MTISNIKFLLKEKFNIKANDEEIKIVKTSNKNRTFIKYKKKHFVYATCDGCKFLLLKQTKPCNFDKIINRKTIFCNRECMHVVIQMSNCIMCGKEIEITPMTKHSTCNRYNSYCRRYAKKEGLIEIPTRIKINCSYCNKEFFTTSYLLSKQEYNSCSRKCGSIIHKQIMKDVWVNRTKEKKQEIFDKMEKTYFKKHGVSHPMHNPDAVEKMIMKTTRGHHGKFLSKKNNKELNYASSFEERAFAILECDSNVILFDRGPSIKYTLNGENKIYHSDICAHYINGTRKIIEIKSKGTLLDKFDKNIAKFQATIIYTKTNNATFELWMEKSLTEKRLYEFIKKYDCKVSPLPEIKFVL